MTIIIIIAIMIIINPELCKKIQDNNVKSAKFEIFFYYSLFIPYFFLLPSQKVHNFYCRSM